METERMGHKQCKGNTGSRGFSGEREGGGRGKCGRGTMHASELNMDRHDLCLFP